ncbi:MAG TPA: hypothetical protein VJ647_05565 [Chitinophagaceae bacterium]|nr:hypothetical protein [Chitinophagaceae bacterium]
MQDSHFSPALSYIHSYGIGSRVGVVGSPDYTSVWMVRSFVAGLPGDCMIVSGNGGIVDSTAIDTARKMGINHAIYKTDPFYHGQDADKKTGREGLCCLVAFLSSLSEPSCSFGDALQLALTVGVPVFMIGPAATDHLPWSAGASVLSTVYWSAGDSRLLFE